MLVLASPQALPLDDSNPSDNGFEGLVLDQHFLLTKLMQGKSLVAMGPTSLLHVRTLVATASAIFRRHMHDHGHEWHEALHHSWYSHTAHPGVIRSDSEAFGCTACFWLAPDWIHTPRHQMATRCRCYPKAGWTASYQYAFARWKV